MTRRYCPILPKNLDSSALDEAMPWSANAACQDWQSLDARAGEQVAIDSTWKDLINSAGQPVYYYVYEYKKQDTIFAEDLLANYAEPFEIKVYLEIQDAPAILQYGGYFANDTITGYIHIKTFEKYTKDIEYFQKESVRYEPKPQDLIQLISFGCDRPGDRGANYYAITNKEDQLISQGINASYGHYVWKFTAKRYMHSHEGNLETLNGESGNEQVFESKNTGIINDVEQKVEKSYSYTVDEISKEEIFNMSHEQNDSIYGGYYE